MPRQTQQTRPPKTPEQREQWAKYMRDYRARKASGTDPRGDIPTERQIEILRAYADPATGGNQRLVAEHFGITTSAVNNAIQRLMKRLGVKDPAQAVYKLWVMEKNGTSHQVPRKDRLGPPPAGDGGS